MEGSDSLRPVILVTGGCGLLGSHLVPLLAQSIPDSEIIVVSRSEGPDRDYDSRVKTIVGDLRDEELWARIPGTITHVMHLAAVIPWRSDDRFKASLVTDNLLPLANLIEHSQRWSRLRQVIYASSVSVYAQTAELLREDSPPGPASLYAAAKFAGEQLLNCLESRGVHTALLRLSSLYAFGQYEGTVLPIMVNRARKDEEILIFGAGSRTQDFLHCEDAAGAFILCFHKQARGIYNVGSGTPVTMTELANSVNRVFANGAAKIVHLPQSDNDPGIKLDISKARCELGYEPEIPLEPGLEKLRTEMESTGG
jgi:UDP-glucose 4-epimerase